MSKAAEGQGSLFETRAMKSLLPEALLARQMEAFVYPPDLEARRNKLAVWVDSLHAGRLAQETSVEGAFLQDLFEEILGYVGPAHSGAGVYTLYPKRTVSAGGGQADAALGYFGRSDAPEGRIVAPIELKGSETDLDRPTGRGLTPVQQGWDYANKTPDCAWVIVSNYRETRLYHTSKTPSRCLRFKLEGLLNLDEFKRFFFCLCAQNLLAEKGRSPLENLVRESESEEAEITAKFYTEYRTYRESLVDTLRQANPGTSPRLILEKAQKILDRVLFVAFAEDRGLLPSNLIRNTYKKDVIGQSQWSLFQSLFAALQNGDAAHKIPAYNGGLFAPDADLDLLHVPESVVASFDRLANYNFTSQLDVDILGHVFEQSVTDLESLRKKHLYETVDAKGGRRKKQGIVYTPAFITQFIYEKTIGRRLAEIRTELESRFPLNDSYDEPKRQAVAVDFWSEYARRIESLRICDPACGSGAFLIACLDNLLGEYERTNKALEGLGQPPRWAQPGETILRENLFGVDIAPESVEITRLALWLKTATSGRKLVDLNPNILCGNSLVENSKVDRRAVDWPKAFPRVFAEGGFDIVLGNPPYVRIQNFSKDSPVQADYFKEHYQSAFKNYDLYVLFVEKGLSLLKKGGLLGFILPNKFFSADYGEGLRGVICKELALLEVVDLDRNKIFEGVTTYPALLFLRRETPEAKWCHLPNGTEIPETLRLLLVDQGPAHSKVEASALDAKRWTVRSGGEGALLDLLKTVRPTLNDLAATIYQGLVTSADPVYILEDLGPEGEGYRKLRRPAAIHKGTKLALPERTVVLEESFLKPFFRDGHVEPFFMAPPTHRILFPYDLSGDRPTLIPEERFKTEAPRTWAWLQEHEALLRMREKGKMDREGWWAYGRTQNLDAFEEPKIVVPGFSEGQCFAFDQGGVYFTGRGDSGYGIRLKKGDRREALFVLAVVNSQVAYFFQSKDASAFQGDCYSSGKRYLAALPIPEAKPKQKVEIATLAESLIQMKGSRFSIQNEGRHRLRVDIGDDANAKLSKKLENWASLTFKELNDELFRLFKRNIPPQDRAWWETHLQTQRTALFTLDEQITAIEKELNQKIYELFGLSTEEILLVEEVP